MDINLVVSDLDGTLLDSNREISDTAVEMIKELKEKGILFTFITGRPAFAVKESAKRVGVTAPIVCCNGAEIVQGDLVFIKHSLRLQQLRKLMEQASALGLTVLYYSNGIEYAMNLTEWVAIRRNAGKPYPIQEMSEKVWASMVAEKVNIMSNNDEIKFSSLRPLLDELEAEYNIVCYSNQGCEIVRKGINKASGLQELSKLLHIPIENIMAIGDNENDNEMLKAAGIGVAVCNAVESTKRCASYICKESNTKGVMEALTMIIRR